ncbi:MAG: ABC transporter ATP-binding protein [Candidatus Pacebacteria bacterium]|nr:ABC transporter ATP-binding protein [Candidatus Paceibacterota bacterium]
MLNSAIEIKNVGKKYNIAHQRGGYVSLRDVITNILKNPFKHAKHKAKKALGRIEKEEFWALKDIDLTIKKGEVIGIIGSNGAGKSTLLKLLSRITPPTTGEIKISGRIASLLEVGTGFHPELTGRENIFLNGAILGMTKKEIVERFDDIVEFSGVEQFIDTPVKRYSSGMYVRLAFAVAAHMEPDILVVDEVLAVGDAEFQKKSLGKLDAVSKAENRTILFVSHNMAAIQKLCKRCILLEGGKIKMVGETKKIIDFYLHRQDKISKLPLEERNDRKGSGNVRFTKCELLTPIPENNTLKLKLSYKNKTENTYTDVKISLSIKDSNKEHITNITNNVLNQRIDIQKGRGDIYIEIMNFNLESGKYMLSLFIATDKMNSEILDSIEDAFMFNIDNNNFYKTGNLPPTRSKVLFNFTFENNN